MYYRILLILLCSVLTRTDQGEKRLINSQTIVPRRKDSFVLTKERRTLDNEFHNINSRDVERYGIELSNALTYQTRHWRAKRNLLGRLISKLKMKTLHNILSDSDEVHFRAAAGNWRYPPQYGKMPAGAYSAGLDVFGRPVYVARAHIPGEASVVPGRVQDNQPCAEVAWKSWGRCVRNYEVGNQVVLVGNKYVWKPGHRNWFPYNNVIGGSQNNMAEGGNQLFICRYYMRDENLTDQLIIGKVTQSGKCWCGYKGEEIVFFNVYEILTLK